MNEDFLISLYDNVPGIQQIGTRDQFIEAFRNNPERMVELYDNVPELQEVGSLEQFQEVVRANTVRDTEPVQQESGEVKGFFRSFGKSAKESLQAMRQQIPTGLKLLLQNPGSVARAVGNIAEAVGFEQINDKLDDAKNKILQTAIDKQVERIDEMDPEIIRSIKDVDSLKDFASYAGSLIGQGAPQILGALTTFGISAFGQMADEIYVGAVTEKAARENKTPEEIIEQGLDHEALLALGAVIGGGLEYIGAKGFGSQISKNLSKEIVKRGIRASGKRALKTGGKEALTEFSQFVNAEVFKSIETNTPIPELFTTEKGIEAIDNIMGGFLSGTSLGGVAEIAGGLSGRGQAQTQETQTAPTAPDTQPAVESIQPPVEPETTEEATEIREGFEFVLKGEEMEIIPSQPEDAFATIRYRKKGSQAKKGNKLRRETLIDRLNDPDNDEYTFIPTEETGAVADVRDTGEPAVETTEQVEVVPGEVSQEETGVEPEAEEEVSAEVQEMADKFVQDYVNIPERHTRKRREAKAFISGKAADSLSEAERQAANIALNTINKQDGLQDTQETTQAETLQDEEGGQSETQAQPIRQEETVLTEPTAQEQVADIEAQEPAVTKVERTKATKKGLSDQIKRFFLPAKNPENKSINREEAADAVAELYDVMAKSFGFNTMEEFVNERAPFIGRTESQAVEGKNVRKQATPIDTGDLDINVISSEMEGGFGSIGNVSDKDFSIYDKSHITSEKESLINNNKQIGLVINGIISGKRGGGTFGIVLNKEGLTNEQRRVIGPAMEKSVEDIISNPDIEGITRRGDRIVATKPITEGDLNIIEDTIRNNIERESQTNVQFQGEGISLEAATQQINNNLIPSLKRLKKAGQDALRASEGDRRQQIRQQIKDIDNTIKHLQEVRGRKEFQEEGTVFRGATVEAARGQAILLALQSPNISTAVHELIHLVEPYFNDTERQVMIDAYNAWKPETESAASTYTTDVSEYVARLWEDYWRQGQELTQENVPDKTLRDQLNDLFKKITQAFKNLYQQGIKYKDKDVRIDMAPKVKKLFDNILTGNRDQTITKKDFNPNVNTLENTDAIDETARLGRLTQEAVDKLKVAIGERQVIKGGPISFNEAIDIANDRGHISVNLDAEKELAYRALNGEALNEFQQIGLMRGLIHYDRQRLEFAEELDRAGKEGFFGNRSIEALAKEHMHATDTFDLFAQAYQQVAGTAGRILVYRKLAEVDSFNDVVFKRNIEAMKIPEKRKKMYLDHLDKYLEKKQKLFEQLDKRNEALNAEESAIAEDTISKMKRGKDGGRKTSGDIDNAFRGIFNPKVKFSKTENDPTGSNDAENKLYDYMRRMVIKKEAKNLEEVLAKTMNDYHNLPFTVKENLTKEYLVDVLIRGNPAAIQAGLTKTDRDLQKVKGIKGKHMKIKGLVDTHVARAKSADPNYKPTESEIKALDELVMELGRVYLSEDFGMFPKEQERILEAISDIKAIYTRAFFSGKPPTDAVIKELVDLANRVNNQQVIDRLTAKRNDLRRGIVADAPVRRKKAAEDKAITKLQHEVRDLADQLKVDLKKAEVYSELVSKYGEERFPLLGKKADLYFNKKNIFNLDNVYEFPRRYLFGGDLSMFLLQGGVSFFNTVGLSVNPLSYLKKGGRQNIMYRWNGLGRAYGQAVKAMYHGARNRKQFALDAYNEIISSSNGVLARQFGLDIVKPFVAGTVATEEWFQGLGLGDLQGDSPLTKSIIASFGRFDKMTEGSFITMLNTTRMEMFQNFRRAHPEATPEQLKAYATFVNNTTGSAKEFTGTKLLSKIFAAPRLYLSRIKLLYQLPGDLVKLAKDPTDVVTRERVKTTINTILGITAMGALLAMSGWEFEDDPRNKNFMKYVKGDKTIDMSAGFGKWVRLGLKTAVYTDENVVGAGLTEYLIGERKKSEEANPMFDSPDNLFMTTLKYSLHPAISKGLDITTGTNIIGLPLGTSGEQIAWNMMTGTFTPLWTQDIFRELGGVTLLDEPDRRSLDNVVELLTQSSAQVMGLNVVDYENNLRHRSVIDHLDKLDYNPNPSFTKKHISKILPELTEGYDNAVKKGRRKMFRKEVQDAVGNRILESLQGGGNPSEATIKNWFRQEGNRVGRLYADYYDLTYRSIPKKKKK